MATDTLEIFGTEYTGVTGIKATDDQSGTKVYIRPQGTKSITANGSGIDVVNYASVDVNVSSGSPTLQTKTKTYTPTTSQQTESVIADSGYDGLSTVSITVNAMPTGTAGTPTATKGTVSNHSVAVTPSVTNTTGYITGGTKTGTAVTVSASELVSGSETKTTNGTYNVTNLAELVVNVSGGGGGAYTCTLTNSGSSDGGIYVKYNNTKYYTSNDSFAFNANDTLSITVNYGDSNAVRVNGAIIAGGSGQFVTNYSYTLPACSISVTFTQGRSYSYIDISVPLHTIHLEFTDSTDTDIDVYYDDALISTMITAYEPTTYGQKTVDSASLDGVTWYEYSNIPLNTQLIDYTKILADYVLDNDGVPEQSQWYGITDYTLISPDMTFSFRSNMWGNIAFYDSSQVFISGGTPYNYGVQSDSEDSNIAVGVLGGSGIRMPSNAAYIRMTVWASVDDHSCSLIRTA